MAEDEPKILNMILKSFDRKYDRLNLVLGECINDELWEQIKRQEEQQDKFYALDCRILKQSTILNESWSACHRTDTVLLFEPDVEILTALQKQHKGHWKYWILSSDKSVPDNLDLILWVIHCMSDDGEKLLARTISNI